MKHRTLPLALYTALQSPDGDATAARLALLSFVLGLAGLLASELLARSLRRWLGEIGDARRERQPGCAARSGWR